METEIYNAAAVNGNSQCTANCLMDSAGLFAFISCPNALPTYLDPVCQATADTWSSGHNDLTATKTRVETAHAVTGSFVWASGEDF